MMLEIIVNIALFIITTLVIISIIVKEESVSEHPLPKPKIRSLDGTDEQPASTEPEPVNENYTPTEYSKFNFNTTSIAYLTLALFALLGCIIGFIAQVFMDNYVLAAKAAAFTLICLFSMFGLWRGYLSWAFWWWR